MNQTTKEYFLTCLALLILIGGTIFSLMFFKPTNMLWQNTNNILAFSGILTSIAFYLFLLDRRDSSIDDRMRISLTPQ